MPNKLNTTNSNVRGAAFLALGLLIFSLQDVAVKSLGGKYPVLEMVILRTLIALPSTLLFYRYEGKRGLPKTHRHTLEYVRGFFLFVSFTTYMMGLAALPLAEISAIRNSAPLMITLLSVFMLGEKVSTRQWVALVIGFVGVLLIVRPGSASFNIGSIFALIATLFYALPAMVTRKLQNTDSSATMTYYSSVFYLAAAFVLSPIVIAIGEIPNAHPSIVFLFRAWAVPTLLDLVIMCGLGLVWAGGMYFVARAYSTAQASAVTPFEYVSLLYSAMWGLLIWHESPTLLTIAGAALTVLSGLYILYLRAR